MKNSMMKALVRESADEGAMYLREVPIPKIADNETLIHVKAVGICGTDLHIYAGYTSTEIPLVIGHEFSGIVEEIGPEVKHIKRGDHVVSRLNIGSCGVCRACLTGNPQMCEHRTCPGFIIDGAYADYIKMDPAMLIKIDDNVPFERAALTEPMAIVAHALLERAKVEAEDRVVVFGPGAIGLLAMMMAKLNGAAKVAVVGTDADETLRLPLAKKLGADLVINSQKENTLEILADFTDEKGIDLAIEASGAASAINCALRCTRKQGRLCVLGLPGKRSQEIEWLTAAEKSLRVMFSYSSSPWSWNIAASMLERSAIDVDSLISGTYALEEYREAFEMLIHGEGVKNVLVP